MNLSRRWLKRDESGTGTLEFALVAPAVILVILAAFDFTRSLLAYTTISNGSREGARYAVLHPTDGRSEIERLVESRTHPLSPDALSVRVEWKYRDVGSTYTLWTDSEDSMPPPSRRPLVVIVKVTVTYPWAATSALAGSFFPASSSSLESTSFMDMRR